MRVEPIYVILVIVYFFSTQPCYGQFFDKLKQKAEEVLSNKSLMKVEKLISAFEKSQPISTTFDDAIYEAEFLGDFEPEASEYSPLELQPKTENGGYKLQSGLYTLNAKSFCLRGYTHGPSKGDGHLYAPLKGKKADFVQLIIQRYGAKPEIPQQDVQVLLWAIIAGADMNALGPQHSKTLNALFTPQERLAFAGKDWLNGYAQTQFDNLKRMVIGNTPPQLQALLDADNKIRSMVQGNKTFQEIEKIAIIAGVAPRDMVREVSKGRWSYHPNGFFVRFFPNGYSQTRIDVYVPYQDAVQADVNGKVNEINTKSKTPKEVIFDPSGMVASPANRPSQRIGVSPVPVDDIPCKEAFLSLFGLYGEIKNQLEEVNCSKSKVGWIVDNQINNCNLFAGKNYQNIQIGNNYNANSKLFHCYYVEKTICDKAVCPNCTEDQVFKTLLQNASYAAPTDEFHPVTNCSITDVNIPCWSDNPIVTTVHPKEKAIINYTVSYQEMIFGRAGVVYPRTHSHYLHPGKVQRKIFTEGSKIKIATMGEGSGRMPEVNLIYAFRTWGAVDNRLINAFKCK